MAERAVVLGTGPDGLRAAAALATAGRAVTLLQACDTEVGLEHPELPVDSGRMRVDSGLRARVEAVVGALVDAPDPMRGVAVRGKTSFLPLTRPGVAGLFEPRVAVAAAQGWSRARARNRMSLLLGGGQEERTYRDWVERRFGGPAYHHLFRAYAQHRFGASCDELAASVARVHHGVADSAAQTVAGGGSDEALRHAAAVVRDSGGEIRVGVEVQRLVVEAAGREQHVVAVDLGDEQIPVAGRLWVARTPSVVASWLEGSLTDAILHDAQSLEVRDALQVALRGETDGLPDELNVLDEAAPFFRVVSPYGTEKTAIFHTLIATDADTPSAESLASRYSDAARSLGIGDFEGPARVNRLAEWVPVWSQTAHARLRRVLLALDALGVIGVGRTGAFGMLDPGEELRLVFSLLEEQGLDQHEAHRALVDPPVLVDDLFASITQFLAR